MTFTPISTQTHLKMRAMFLDAFTTHPNSDRSVILVHRINEDPKTASVYLGRYIDGEWYEVTTREKIIIEKGEFLWGEWPF